MGQTPQGLGEQVDQWCELQLVDSHNQVYFNIRNQRMYIRRSIVLGDIGHIQYELDVYNFRRINDRFVVSVDYCSNIKEPEMCSTVTALTYYIEKQEYTLFQKNSLPLLQGMAILLHALQGFRILYDKFGYFTPSSKLIFFNYLHEVRVWISEDLKITKNLQNAHGAKSLNHENTFIRQIVHLFDSVRDPQMPNVRYSQFLPNHHLSFQMAHDIFLKRSAQMSFNKLPQKRVFTDIKNVQPQFQPPLKLHKNAISYQNSPVNSPRMQSPHHLRKENAPTMNFTYRSPIKRLENQSHGPAQSNTIDIEQEQIKHAAKLSLKNTSAPIKPFSYLEPSREFTSTMPNSIRNSGIFEKHVIIQKLDPTPLLSRDSSAKNLKEEKKLMKQAAHRYSQAQENILPFENCPKKVRILKVSLQQDTRLHSQKADKHSDTAAVYDQQLQEEKPSNNFLQKKAKNQSGPNFNDQIRRQFQTHKRHQTDFKMPSKMKCSDDSEPNQVSMDGNYLSKFRLNTIKSIHLLDQDKEYDRQILVDLKQIINKYRKLA